MRWLRLLVFLVVIVSVGTARGSVEVWGVSDGGNGHAYDLVGNYLDPLQLQRWSWQTSKVMAEAMEYLGMQGHLVTITSAAENQFLIDHFHNDNPWPTWIGLTDSEDFGGYESYNQPNRQVDGWKWVTGEAVTFTNWTSADNPDNLRDEDFVVMGSQWGDHHMWNDEQGGGGAHAPFFVEFEPATVPEPASLAVWSVLSMVGVGCGWWRKRRSN